MSDKWQEAVTTPTAPRILMRPAQTYNIEAGLSSPKIREIKELLGDILLAVHWPNAGDEDRATLLLCVDGLERRLIDLRREGSRDG